MKGVLVKDLYIAGSNILVTIVSLAFLGFGMSFMASTGIITGLVLLINLVFPVKENILLAFNIVIISVIWFFISYRITVKVYCNRDIT